jgi:hypothetical protein
MCAVIAMGILSTDSHTSERVIVCMYTGCQISANETSSVKSTVEKYKTIIIMILEWSKNGRQANI